MDSSRDDSSSDERETSINTNSNQDRKYHRHSNSQIERLEAYFKECPHPDELQRQNLGEELNLSPKQIKFWFQNKRTQTKAQNERSENAALKAANMKIVRDNEVMRNALETVVCPPCGGPRLGKEERELNLQKLRLKNAALKEQHEKLKSYVNQLGGQFPSSDASLPNIHGPSSYATTSTDNRHVLYGSSSQNVLEPPSILSGPNTHENANITQVPQPPQPQRQPLQLQHFQPLSQVEKIMMSETALNAVSEVMRLIQTEEPMWTKSSIDGRPVIDPDNYEKMFTKNHFKSPNARPESSKDVVVVPMDARTLIDVFFNTEKWARVFPTIVNEAKTIHVLESMDQEGQTFLKLMYEQLHILSPLVPPREFMVLRCCQRMGENLWMIADVSYNLPNIEFEFPTPICFKRPSGVLIQALPNARSKVTWMEHVVIEEKMRMHRLYKDVVGGGFGYGARRWTVTLERMCERLSLSSISAFPNTDHGGAVKFTEGRKSVLNLGERMIKNFAWTLKMSKKLDFSQLSETNNSGVRVSVRVNKEDGQPPGLVVCACSSLSLPKPPLEVYKFLKEVEHRHQWDVLCHGNPAAEVARFFTGTDLTNCVDVLQPSGATMPSEMMIIQDGFIDALGGMVVYAPMDINTAYSALLGQVDPAGISILPSGFVISLDGRPTPNTQLEGGRDHSTTLLTVAFQILVGRGRTYAEDTNMDESTTAVNTLVSSTVQRIKAMLNCQDGQRETS
ncbi:hypothetical protein AALP_AA2G144800 [Arabis alpina]|uniref:Uncharacterized protein n=1 Tax=Arabis alpina TaxID=50452 RepID=A0A087HHF6_ARAAL|nr:hypothetical protein AALP_AA2G144800 [Arabis alpina]